MINKKLILWMIGIMIIEALIFYRIGKQDAATELRQQYPQVINFRKAPERMEPKNGDLWITDSAYVHYYITGSGWAKAQKPQ